MKTLAFLVACVATPGCEKKAHVAPAQAGAPIEAQKAEPGAVAPAQATGDPAPAQDPAIGAAMQAARENARGDTPCEQAYSGMEALVTSLQKNASPGGASSANLPPKGKFLAACRELPETMQKCMVMSYALVNQKACMEARQKLDPATAARVKAMMGR